MPRFPHRLLMTATQRLMVYGLMAALWLSGCVWLYLDLQARHQDAFGGERNPWEPAILTAHGILAVVSMYLLGWITSHHIVRWWTVQRRRISGSALSLLMLILIVSGFALFFVSDDRWQHYAALVHDVLGVAVVAFAAQHWFAFRRTQRDAEV